MREISKKSAAALAGMYPLPKMGCEITIAAKKDSFGGFFRLQLQNVCGDYFIASSQVKVDHWPAVFEVQVTQ